MMRRAMLAVVLVCLSFSVAADTPPTKEQRVRELLVVIRAGDMGVQIVDQMIVALKGTVPTAPEEFWKGFRSKVKPEELVEMLVPVYMKYLETTDIEELIRFYKSPAGQHFLDAQPVMMSESMAVGQAWGERLAKEAYEELQKTHKDE